ncbi:MAG TPA: YqgQ family protein [Savagea sp.]
MIHPKQKFTSYYDVLQLLRKYNTFVYTGDLEADALLIEMELAELRDNEMIDQATYLQAVLLVKKRVREEKERKS